ncbi:alpha/beta hydrolase [Actinomadura macrotermitis]|uniref:alpha/beta hydrolase n=1 Tax=Actinomadura macrotermitis TaxID=2585200 RepID=UPI0018865763|nr:alpha/beta hydrolase [Actinomadura macrotermitis]
MRKRARIAAVAAGLASIGVLTPIVVSHAAVGHTKSYAYGSHKRQALDAYWNDPKPGSSQPGIVILHGGYWQTGKKIDWKANAEWFAGQGFAVFSVDYRFNTDAPWPAPRDDAMAAVAWIKSHASSFRLDPGRIAVIGSQSGGQLAAHLGTSGSGGARVRGVVGLSPIASPRLAYDSAQTSASTTSQRKARDQTVLLANCSPTYSEPVCAARYQDMAAATGASADDAPMLLVHSAGDMFPALHSEQLRTALTAAGDGDVTVRTVTGSASGGPLLTTGERDQVLAWIRARTASRAAVSATTPRPGDTTGKRPPALVPSRRTTDDGTAAAPRISARTTASRIEQTGLAYGTDARQKIDAYYHPSAARRPAILMIHGGYWYEGDKSSWAGQARWFSDHGYAVFAAGYRLNTQAAWPAQRTDVIAAVNWIKVRAATYAVDPKRVVLLGSSAGGHLVTNVGTYGTGTGTVKAVAAVSPVASPYKAYYDGEAAGAKNNRHKLRDTAVLLTRCTPEKADTACWNRWVDAVSFNHASAGDTPMYLVHSAGDFVPPQHSVKLCQRLAAVKVSCTARTITGSAHGMDVLASGTVRDDLLKWIQDHD